MRLKEAAEAGILGRLQQDGLLIPTTFLIPEDPAFTALSTAHPGDVRFLEHEKIPFLSHPCEWTPSMLRDAALLTLKIQSELSAAGFSLKDASAYNIQFVGTRPVFIDITSIEKGRPGAFWFGYGQFCRMFLYPWLLAIGGKVTLQEYFLSHMDGLSPMETKNRLGLLASLRPRAFLDVFLPAIFDRKDQAGGAVAASARNGGADAQKMNLRRLEKIFLSNAPSKDRTAWTGYQETNSYDEEASRRKAKFIDEFLSRAKPARILDIGCNTGRFSKIAARNAGLVVAADADSACVDRLYEAVKAEGLAVMPLCVDILNPTPSFGFGGVERSGFLARATADTVMALAVIHHLLIHSNAPLSGLRDILLSVTSRYLLIEYVHPSDSQFAPMAAARELDFSFLTRDHFVSMMSEKAHLEGELELSATRRLMVFRRA